MLDVLAANSIFDVLDVELVKRIPMALGRAFAVEGPVGSRAGITIEPFAGAGQDPALSRDRGR